MSNQAIVHMRERAEKAEAQVVVLQTLLTKTEAKLLTQVREKNIAQNGRQRAEDWNEELRKTIRDVDKLVSPIERR